MKTKFLFFSCLISMLLFTGCINQSKNRQVAKNEFPDSLYLMSYFKSNPQHLFYAYSTDGLNWTDINNSEPIFNAYNDEIWLRDPYMKRVTRNGVSKFHMVHTWGWDNPAIFHWESDDLITWKATDGSSTTDSGKIFVMDGKNGNASSKNAWAPEFTYDPDSDLFYIYWASDDGTGYLRHHYCTTRDWMTFSPSKVYFDPGFTTIDMTILPYNGIYYAFYKDERNGQKKIRLATSKSLNPEVDTFSGTTELFPEYPIEVEGPEIFKSLKEDKWFLYWDKFINDMGISFAVSSDLASQKWELISDEKRKNPTAVKHGSVEVISKDELKKLLDYYSSKK